MPQQRPDQVMQQWIQILHTGTTAQVKEALASAGELFVAAGHGAMALETWGCLFEGPFALAPGMRIRRRLERYWPAIWYALAPQALPFPGASSHDARSIETLILQREEEWRHFLTLDAYALPVPGSQPEADTVAERRALIREKGGDETQVISVPGLKALNLWRQAQRLARQSGAALEQALALLDALLIEHTTLVAEYVLGYARILAVDLAFRLGHEEEARQRFIACYTQQEVVAWSGVCSMLVLRPVACALCQGVLAPYVPLNAARITEFMEALKDRLRMPTLSIEAERSARRQFPDIQEGLARLQTVLDTHHPELTTCLRSGLQDEEVDALEMHLAPYKLPIALRSLYKWHDGATVPLTLLPGYDFLSLAEALEEYQQIYEFDHAYYGSDSPDGERWNPLWFPIFAFEGNYYCIALAQDTATDSPVYLADNDDPDLYLEYDSLAALVAVATACFERRVYSVVDTYLEEDYDQARAIRETLVPHCAPFVQQEGLTIFSKDATVRWPQAWRDAIGRTAADYVPHGKTMTVAECVRAVACGELQEAVLHGQVTGLGGSGARALCRVEDETGRVTVWCPVTARGARDLDGGRWNELKVEPNTIVEHAELEARAGTPVVRVKRVVPLESFIREQLTVKSV